MLRNRNNQATGWLQRSMDFAKHLLIFLDVLDDVKATHDVKLASERNPPSVHLEEGRAAEPFRSSPQTQGMYFTSVERQILKRRFHAAKHITRAAADLEKVRRRRKMGLKRPTDKLVARAKPEVCGL